MRILSGENRDPQRSICARVLDLQNQDKMKRRRAGVVHELGQSVDEMERL